MPESLPTIPDPKDPEYFLEDFPRDAFPAYTWTERPATLPDEVWTTETTHRDGQQGGLPLTTEQCLAIYDLQCRFTGDSRRDSPGRVLRLSPLRLEPPSKARSNATAAARPSSRPPGFAPPPAMSS